MTEESDFRDLMFIEDDLPATGIARWLPTAVVVTAVIGFVTLAWYAYHAGTQSLKDDDLLVVEADKTPVKEKPADPGGMKFPNQDKTIFDTFANNAQQPPKVERVLPEPEEPMSKEVDNSGTETWINDKSHKADSSKPEQIIGKEEKKAEKAAAVAPAAAPVKPVEEEAKPLVTADNDKTETYLAAPWADKDVKPAAAPVKEAKKEEKAPAKAKEAVPAKVKEAAPAPAPVKTAKPAATGNARVQLGAYRSEKEARDAWDNIQKKSAALSGKEPTIVKADLGAKGIYYRLRVGGLGSAADAKSLCSKLSAGGQACILPTD